MSPPRIAVVAALQREVWPLVKSWERSEQEYQNWHFVFFVSEQAAVVCGGIGTEAARRATEAVVALYHPAEIWSVGFAGALDAKMKVGQRFLPNTVIDAGDGSRVQTGNGDGVLVTFNVVADVKQKAKLGKAYGAQAVDMEAAAVARGAQKHDLPFRAVKVISDEATFAMPDLSRFITRDGRVRASGIVLFAAIRPWLWPGLIKLGANSRRSARILCQWLEQNIAGIGEFGRGKQSAADVHALR